MKRLLSTTFIAAFGMLISPQIIKAQTGVITTVCGTGTSGFAADGTVATAAQIAHPIEVAIDSHNNIYFAENGNNKINDYLVN